MLIRSYNAIAVVLSIIFLNGCSDDTQQNISDPLEIVKQGTLEFDRSVTINNVFSNYNYFGETGWEIKEDEYNRKIATFVGVFDFDKFIGSEYPGVNVVLTKQ